MGRIFRFIKTMYYRLLDDDVLALGAQMAYYLILSFFLFNISYGINSKQPNL